MRKSEPYTLCINILLKEAFHPEEFIERSAYNGRKLSHYLHIENDGSIPDKDFHDSEGGCDGFNAMGNL
jgi:hypothetical protein